MKQYSIPVKNLCAWMKQISWVYYETLDSFETFLLLVETNLENLETMVSSKTLNFMRLGAFE